MIENHFKLVLLAARYSGVLRMRGRDLPSSDGLNLLLCDAADHRPVLPANFAPDTARSQTPPPATNLRGYLWDEGKPPNDLAAQRWGVIVPEGTAGDRLLGLCHKLLKRREEQQGAPVRIFRAPAKGDQADALQWRKQHFDSGVDTLERLPRYQLILGNLDQVALSIQQVQSTDGLVGRLAFDAESGYEAYIDKVLRYEDKTAASAGRAMFYTVHDGSKATRMGYQSLIAPGVELAQRKVQERKLTASEIIELGDPSFPSRGEFLEKSRETAPSVLFTLSHGAGAPRGGWKSTESQRSEQGAMSFANEGLLYGSEIAAKPFLPGGIWFMLACYGAGTPDESAYHHWLQELSRLGKLDGSIKHVLSGLPRSGERPFIAALPQAALANPDGPLAFVGHIDLAWTYSFAELDTGKAVDRPGRFIQVVTQLLNGDRCGIGLRALMMALGSTNTELTALYQRIAYTGESSAATAARLGHLWMLRQDLASYVLLGDPAVRLPIHHTSASATPPAVRSPNPTANPSDLSALFGFQSTAARPLVEVSDFDRIEKAMAQVILQLKSIEQAAAELRMTGAELSQKLDRYRQAGRTALK